MNRADGPFKIVSTLAIIVGGFVAAAIAYHPTEPMVWMVAYLVLAAGVVQYIFGAGQAALLSHKLPSLATVLGQLLLLSLGNIGVIFGTLRQSLFLLIAGTIIYNLSLIWLAIATKQGKPVWCRWAYWFLLLAMFVSSIIGIALSPFS